MNRTVTAQLLASILLAAAACGPSSPEPTSPTTAGPGAEQTPGEAPTGETPHAHGEATGEPGAAKAPAHSVPISQSQMLAEVAKLGIDMKKVPDLSKLPLGKKKKIMPLFQKSLGFSDCTGCHVEGDFKKETRNIEMARNMWNHYVAKLRDEKGGPVFCDSCHSGKEHLLDRQDKDALQKFMEEEYQNKLTRADGEEHSCSTCHTDAFETKIFEKLWGIPAGSGS